MRDADPEKLRRLFVWVQAWRAAHESYFGWISAEWQRRLAQLVEDRRKARVLLDRATKRMPFDKRGRVAVGSRGHAQAKQTMRRDTDKVLEAVITRGLEILGARGQWNRFGVFVGGLDPSLRRLALRRIRDALAQAADEAGKLLTATEKETA